MTSGKLVVAPRGPDRTPIVLPAQLGELSSYIGVYQRSHTPAATRTESAVSERTNVLTGATYSQAYGGAAVTVQQYATDDLSVRDTVVAIRASSSPLLPGVLQNPQDTGLLALPTEVITIGTTRCLIRRFLHGPGGDLDPFKQATDECQRTGPQATVFTYTPGSEGSVAQQRAVDLTETAYALLAPAQ